MTNTPVDELREATKRSIALLVSQRRGAETVDEQDLITASNILFVCSRLIRESHKGTGEGETLDAESQPNVNSVDVSILEVNISSYPVVLHDEDGDEVEAELGDLIEVDSIMQLILQDREQHTREVIRSMFPEYDNVTNPTYTFMIAKYELDEELNQLTNKDSPS